MAAVLDRLRATIPDLVSLVSTASPAALRRRPVPDEWSAALVVGHLADAELVYGVRIRLTLTAYRPVLAAYDEKAWAQRFGPLEDDIARTLARFRAVRESTIGVLETLTDDEWARVAVHEERGAESVADIAAVLADHDRDHLDQIRQALATTSRHPR